MPTSTNSPSKMRGSMGLIRGYPSERSVARRQSFPVAVCRRTKTSAIRGDSSENVRQATTPEERYKAVRRPEQPRQATWRSSQALRGRAASRQTTTRSLAFRVPSQAPTGQAFDMTMPLCLSSSMRGWSFG